MNLVGRRITTFVNWIRKYWWCCLAQKGSCWGMIISLSSKTRCLMLISMGLCWTFVNFLYNARLAKTIKRIWTKQNHPNGIQNKTSFGMSVAVYFESHETLMKKKALTKTLPFGKCIVYETWRFNTANMFIPHGLPKIIFLYKFLKYTCLRLYM